MWILWRTPFCRVSMRIRLGEPCGRPLVRGVHPVWTSPGGPPPLCTGPTGVVQTRPRIHPPVVHIPVHRARPHPSKPARSCGFRLWRPVDTCGQPNDIRVIHQPVRRRRPQGCGRGVSGLIPPSTGAEVVHSAGGSPQSCPHRWTMWKKTRVPVEGSNRDSRVGRRVAQAPRCFRLISLVSSVTWL